MQVSEERMCQAEEADQSSPGGSGSDECTERLEGPEAGEELKVVDVTDTEDEEKRYSLFVELLEASHREVEFQHLALLLQAWPPVKREYTVTSNPWVRLATAMLTRCTVENKEGLGNEVLKICRSLYNTEQMLPAEGVKELCSLLLHQALLLPSLKLLLESQDEHLHAMALDHVTAIAKGCDENTQNLCGLQVRKSKPEV
ncbi:hypothetical protein J1605_021575 [Eschrichtius robustus]|uniref:Neuroblastoma-amplified sequence n=1 Tax=Eschrichtius robustus TaxID=9764 RepID=A0AB34HFE3_ESCRO|nr:hypothetical protein J1605_021575 [Eschrichtius robustus]